MNPDPAQLPEQNSSSFLDLQAITVEARTTLRDNPLQSGIELPLVSDQLEASPQDHSPEDQIPKDQEPNQSEEVIQEKKPILGQQPPQVPQQETPEIKISQSDPSALNEPAPQPVAQIPIARKKDRIQLNKKMKNAGYTHLALYDENRKTNLATLKSMLDTL
jgi:hypothetical protein